MGYTTRPGGDLDVAAVAALFADPTRARILGALGDGRSLPATVLAAEAGVTPQAASPQLGRLVDGGLLAVERSGRHRYYRLASAQVATVLEAMAPLASMRPVRSLRQSTRAAALRTARTCYDHLAGRLGVQLLQALVERDALMPVDGLRDTRRREGDPLAAAIPGRPYVLGPSAPSVFRALGVPTECLTATSGSRRPLLRFCLDWSEQRHHLAGGLGAELLAAFTRAGWVAPSSWGRAVELTPAGRQTLQDRLQLAV